MYHDGVEFQGEAERFAVVGREVAACGEFGDDAVVESQLLFVVEDTWEEGVFKAAVAAED